MTGPHPRRSLLKTVLFIASLILFLRISDAETTAPKVTLIITSGIRPYKVAVEGFKKALKFSVRQYIYSANPKLVEHILTNEPHDVLVAVGPQAARAISHVDSNIPKVYLMVLDPWRYGENGDVCGIDLRIPPRTQLNEIKDRFGQGVRIGILYHPEENQKIVDSFIKDAQKLSLEIVAIPVGSPRESISALKKNANNLDCLLFIPDSVVIKEALVQYLIKHCIMKGIAAIGYNHFFVESGAVMSLSIDYSKVGELGASLVHKLLEDEKCKVEPPPYIVEWNEKAWNTVKQGH